MILKTQVHILKEDISKMTDEEKEKYEAKKEYLAHDLKDEDIEYTLQLADSVIDTEKEHLYIDVGDGVIRLRPLLGTDLVGDEGTIPEYIQPSISFLGSIDDIYKKLQKENK